MQLSIIQKFMKLSSKTCYYLVLEVPLLEVLLSYNNHFMSTFNLSIQLRLWLFFFFFHLMLFILGFPGGSDGK